MGTKMNPLYNQFVVAEYEDGKPFLGYLDHQGTCYTDKFMATGFGKHMSLPMIRTAYKEDMTEQEARGPLLPGLLLLERSAAREGGRDRRQDRRSGEARNELELREVDQADGQNHDRERDVVMRSSASWAASGNPGFVGKLKDFASADRLCFPSSRHFGTHHILFGSADVTVTPLFLLIVRCLSHHCEG